MSTGGRREKAREEEKKAMEPNSFFLLPITRIKDSKKRGGKRRAKRAKNQH